DGTAVPGAFGAGTAAPVLFETFARLKAALDPLPPPPPATLIAANPALPPPLRRFRGRDGALAEDPLAPAVAFPPDGAEVETADGGLLVRVRNGVAPFTWMADGRPFAVATREREAWLEDAGPGFLTVSVIDAEGRSARVRVILR
ncbi:MAG: penicillin-binding protein 1C, partial [Rhodobacteraceae bacterium]|nr:penicillin-binding protein 1C [Paracoccaceae bacterium]